MGESGDRVSSARFRRNKFRLHPSSVASTRVGGGRERLANGPVDLFSEQNGVLRNHYHQPGANINLKAHLFLQ